MAPRLEFTAAAAFDELVAIHLNAAYGVALAILRKPYEARDAVQEAAFKAWRNFGKLSDGGAARPWQALGRLSADLLCCTSDRTGLESGRETVNVTQTFRTRRSRAVALRTHREISDRAAIGATRNPEDSEETR